MSAFPTSVHSWYRHHIPSLKHFGVRCDTISGSQHAQCLLYLEKPVTNWVLSCHFTEKRPCFMKHTRMIKNVYILFQEMLMWRFQLLSWCSRTHRSHLVAARGHGRAMKKLLPGSEAAVEGTHGGHPPHCLPQGVPWSSGWPMTRIEIASDQPFEFTIYYHKLHKKNTYN